MNSISEKTGTFVDRQMTTILVAETDAASMIFERDEEKLVSHLESLSDQIVLFENEVKLGY